MKGTLDVEQFAEALAAHLERVGPRNGNGSPWWSKAVWQVGPVVVMLFIFLGMITGWVPSPLSRIAGIETMIEKHMATQEEALRLWRTMCRNTAKTDMQRDMCDR